MGETFYLKQGDTTPALRATLEDGSGSAVNLTGAGVRFKMDEPRGGGNVVDDTVTVQDASGGVVEYTWKATDTETPGRYRAEFVVTYQDSTVETFPNDDYHTIIVSR